MQYILMSVLYIIHYYFTITRDNTTYLFQIESDNTKLLALVNSKKIKQILGT